jgi:hypothetical protein
MVTANTFPPTIAFAADGRVGSFIAVVTGTWVDAPVITYQWRRNAVNIPGATAKSYRIVAADAGQEIDCAVTGLCPDVVSLTAPVLDFSAGDGEGDIWLVSDGTWSGDPTSFEYVWTRNGVPILGATNNSYVLQAADVGAEVGAEVIGISACGSESPLAFSFPNTHEVSCLPITNAAAPTLAAGASPVVPGTVLTITSNGTWVGFPLSYTYIWYRDGVTIAGEVGTTYTVLAGDVGKTITAKVIASNACTNSLGTATSPTGFVVCAAVANTVAPVISGLLPEGSLLSTTNGTWSGSPTTFTYQWRRNGGALGGATASTYTTVAGDVGQSITCTVTATNACGSVASQESNALVPTSVALPPCANCNGIQTNGLIVAMPSCGITDGDPAHSYCFQHYDDTPNCSWHYAFDANHWVNIDYGITHPGEFTVVVRTAIHQFTTNAPGYRNPAITCVGGQLVGSFSIRSTGSLCDTTASFGPVAPCIAPCTFCSAGQPSMTVSGWIGGCVTNNGTYTFTVFVPGSPCTWVWDKLGAPSVVVTFNAGVWTISQPGGTAVTNSGVSCQSNTIVGVAVADNLPGICNPPVTPITFSFP